ncbi:hypothetical protein ANCCAN_26072 [Ancylostoma caninum]|uniref:Amiloride-sensitive sodium channel n=1 Tax=Ancylostoma caninum TaxID=29170 RepID=A0A368FB16_ANCCA|nr:hypothetical protein ANCCAN_26072 [Ancylostoma caninum]
MNDCGDQHSPNASIIVDTNSAVPELPSEKNELYEIIRETDMDGVRQLRTADPSARHVFIYMWCIIITVFIIFALIQIRYQIMLFYSEPVTTNIEIEYPSAIVFPAVAICNNNQIR